MIEHTPLPILTSVCVIFILPVVEPLKQNNKLPFVVNFLGSVVHLRLLVYPKSVFEYSTGPLIKSVPTPSSLYVVSGGEIERALNAGPTGKDIIYAGVGKTDEELTYAIKTKIHCINVESQSELTRINDICEKLNTKQNISLRVNPDVDAKTHVKITTGKAENKFGIEFDYIKSMYAIASELPNVNIIGISVHIGSQITNLKPFKKAFQIIYDLINDLRGLGHKIKHVDLGGGLGVTYSDDDNVPTFKEYASLIQSCSV